MSRKVSLPFLEWPEADRSLWISLTSGDDPLGDLGALIHLRATSRAGYLKQYGRWLEWLVQTDPEALGHHPTLRATPKRFDAYITSLAHLIPQTRHSIVLGLLCVLRPAAPRQDWRLQNLASKRLERLADRSRSDRKTGRILSSSVLFAAGKSLIGPKATAANTSLNAALMRRNGTMIALLSMMPIRLRALSELSLASSLQVTPTRMTMCLTGAMTKNGYPWEAAVPAPLEPILRRYIEEVRPWLMRRLPQMHDALWVGRMGDPLTYGTMKNTITLATKCEIGIAISPHLFRDAAATTLVRQSPADTMLIRSLLGHSSFDIATKHYIHATGIEAGRDYAAVLANLREDG